MGLCQICERPKGKNLQNVNENNICDCPLYWEKFNNEIDEIYCKSVDNSVDNSDYKPSKLIISTLSSNFKLCEPELQVYNKKNNISFIDLEFLKNNFKLKKNRKIVYDPDSKGNKNIKTTKRGNDIRRFYNQATITLHLPIGKNVSVKIFPNGSAQMTGCPNLLSVLNIVQLIKKIMLETTDKNGNYCIKNIKDLKIRDLKIDLINSNFDTGINIKQEILTHILNENHEWLEGRDEDYDPNVMNWVPDKESIYSLVPVKHSNNSIIAKYGSEKYQGINLKYKTSNLIFDNKKKIEKNVEISILIFKSGKIIITAARNPSDLNEGYFFINNVIRKYKKYIDLKIF